MTLQAAADSDSVRAVLRAVFEAPEYQWRRTRSLGAFLAETWRRIMDWLQAFADAHPLGYTVLIFALTAVLVVLLVHLTSVVWRALRTRAEPAPAAAGVTRVPHPAAWYLEQALGLVDQGRFREALAHRFTALVLDLERRGLLATRVSRTPAEYAREVALDHAGRAAFAALVERLYEHGFGGVPCGPREWTAFDQAAHGLARHVATR